MDNLFESCIKVNSYEELYELTNAKKGDVVAVVCKTVKYPWHNIIYYKCHIVEGQQVWAGNSGGKVTEYQDLRKDNIEYG